MMVTINTRLLRTKITEKGFDHHKDLAEKAGITRTTLSNTLTGKSVPSLIVANELCRALDLTPEEAANIFFAPNLHHMQVLSSETANN